MTAPDNINESSIKPQSDPSSQQVPGSCHPSHTFVPPTADVEANACTDVSVYKTKDKSAPKKSRCFGRRAYSIASRAGRQLNKAAHVAGAEGWWPTNMQSECEKAARILHSLTTLGDPSPPTSNGPMHRTGLTGRKSVLKIPDTVLRNCAGLAIFNVARAGVFYGSLAAGSGVVIARRPDGTWSPPSSFVVSTLGAGFLFGLDIYGCVCVLNTTAQVDAFTKPRLSLGGDISIALGPVGTGASAESALSKTVRPVWAYMKSRGLWAGVQVDGTIILSRANGNAMFYAEPGITAKKILHGDMPWPMAAKPLFDVLKAIDDRPDPDVAAAQDAEGSPAGGVAAPTDEKWEPVVDVKEQGQKESSNDNSKDSSNDPSDEKQGEHQYESSLSEKERLKQAGF